MCRQVKGYLAVLREYTREIFTFGGIMATVWIYTDFKNFLSDQSRILSELAVRIEHIERQLEK